MKPFDHPDIVLALGVALIVGLLFVPLPTLILDLFISVNVAAGFLILMVALFAKNALEVATFPSILLLTTLFRLALNVSTTRQILGHADAGEVVDAFGKFVIGGDLIVGMVVFMVITLVQFMVIAKGAERVAEVGARFTLDAMPGKQMSIDAALRNGMLTDREAQEKRDELGRECHLFGNMDGAMKFVKGDAVAGLIMVGLNLVAGFTIGIARDGLTAAESARIYSILTVGDGLVSQIPALLITLAAGILVTRVESKDVKNTKPNLGGDVQREFFGSFKALGVASFLMIVAGCIPGLPTLPFWIIGVAIIGLKVLVTYFRERKYLEMTFQEQLEEKVEEAKSQRGVADLVAPSVVPIGIELDPVLTVALGLDGSSGENSANELIDVLLPQLRDALYLESGVRFPGVRVSAGLNHLPRGSFLIRIRDVPVHQNAIDPDKFMAMVGPERLKRLGVTAERGVHPLTEGTVSLFRAAEKPVVEASGIPVWSPAGVITLDLASVLRNHAKEFIGLQEASEILERMETAYPALAKEVVPKIVGLGELAGVLRRLVDEGVSIRDMKTIFEALGEHGRHEHDELVLTERVRAALSSQLVHAYAGMSGNLKVLLLDPMIEDTIRAGMHPTNHGVSLALEPEVMQAVLQSVRNAMAPAIAEGIFWPAILTAADIRRLVRKMLELDFPRVPVLSFDELPGDLSIQPLGRASIMDVEAAA